MKYCPKCDKKFSDKDLFCDKCGGNLKKKEKETKPKKEKEAKPKKEYKLEEKEKTTPKWIYIGGGIVILAIIFIFAVPMPYSATESYTEEVPYEAQEEYAEQEPYTDRECTYRDYNAEGGYINEEGTWKGDWRIRYGLFDTGGNLITKGIVHKYYIENYEDKSNKFIIRLNFWGENKVLLESRDVPIWVKGGQIKYGHIGYSYLSENRPSNADSFNVQLVVPKMEKCETLTKYRTVTKSRTVTKYRDEEKTKQVTKYATLFQQWIG